MSNPFKDSSGFPVVAQVQAGTCLKEDLTRLFDALGGLHRVLSPEDRILLKPNINSWHDSPAAVDPDFLASLIDVLYEEGFCHLAVAESSGRRWGPTAEVVQRKGILPLLRERDVPFICLDDEEWEVVDTGGDFLPRVHLPKVLKEYDKLVYVPNLKTHGDAGFTVCLKVAMGLTPLRDRDKFHQVPVPAAVADLARVIWPDLCVVDGRKAFIEGGPTFGTEAEPGVILASGDPVACDIQAAQVLIKWGAGRHLGTDDPRECEQIRSMGDRVPHKVAVRCT